MAGIPVYSQPGRSGGWSLVGGARTDLSGLTAAEVRTLFLIAGPSAATPEVRAALRKLVRALPETFRAEAEAAASAVVLDPTGWDHHRSEPPPHLGALQKAVIDGVQIELGYKARDGVQTTRVVHPLGLVAKRSVWYLVAGTDSGMRTFRVNRVLSVVPNGEPVDRPEGFDLEESWKTSMATLDEQRVPCVATVRAKPEVVPGLRAALGTPVTVIKKSSDLTEGNGDQDGRVEVRIRGYSPKMIASLLAGFGLQVEVVDPEEVRVELSRIATELSTLYEGR